jgi:hypothetical protein
VLLLADTHSHVLGVKAHLDHLLVWCLILAGAHCVRHHLPIALLRCLLAVFESSNVNKVLKGFQSCRHQYQQQHAPQAAGLGMASTRCLIALLLCSVATAAVAQVVNTNRCREDACMASSPEPDDTTKAVSGYYEPLGQAPIAVAHALQLPCGNKFLVMVG